MVQFSNLSNDTNLTHSDFLNTGLPIPPDHSCFYQASGREDSLISYFQRGLPPLSDVYKNGSIFHVNVNYCYDTQDNLTCFGNLFFLVIRCSNWKIFLSVTTVLKVKWQGKELYHRISAINLDLGVQLAVTWVNHAKDQKWTFCNQVGGTHDLQELDDSRERQNLSRWSELPWKEY